MLELFNTGRLAYKCGKWRGLVYLLSALAPLFMDALIARLFGLIPGDAQPPEFTVWLKLCLYGAALVAWLYGAHALYRDHAHGDYLLEAERYKRQGW